MFLVVLLDLQTQVTGMSINRRSFIRQASCSVTSIFVIGQLDVLNQSKDEPENDLLVAAAATFEYVLQTFVFENVYNTELPEITEETRRAAKEVSLGLEPHNAPAIFEQATFLPIGRALKLVFSDSVQVVISEIRVEQFKLFLRNVGEWDSPSSDDVLEFLEGMLALLRSPDMFNYD
jgi:hypothetical protein